MVVKKNSKSKKKLTSSEIMERVIDVEELEKRKQNLVKEESASKEETVIEKEKQWWQLPMKKLFLKLKSMKVSFMGNMKVGVKMYGLDLMILKNG